MPSAGFGNSSPVIVFKNLEPTLIVALNGVFASLALDYAARQKLGGANMTFGTTQQLPIIIPAALLEPAPWHDSALSLRDWLLPRILELTYTAWDLEPFAQDCGWSRPPFRWDEERRFLISGCYTSPHGRREAVRSHSTCGTNALGKIAEQPTEQRHPNGALRGANGCGAGEVVPWTQMPPSLPKCLKPRGLLCA